MAVTNFSTADAAASSLVNAAIPAGITPSVYLSAQQLPMSILANMLQGQVGGATLAVEGGAGFTGGEGTVLKTGVSKAGDIIKTEILVDLTGLDDFAAGDIIGVDESTAPAHLGRITTARNGTIFAVKMTCVELPADGDVDIDLYSATEGTGAPDAAISTLTETLLINAGDWAAGDVKIAQTIADGQYLYLVNGSSTPGTYTAGKYLIELFGY